MRIIIIVFLILGTFSCSKETKKVTLHFPDSINDKQLTIISNHYGILTDNYAPSVKTINTTDSILTIQIADSTEFVQLKMNNEYLWMSNLIINTNVSKQLDIYIDPLQQPKFVGHNAEMYNRLYPDKNDLSIGEQLSSIKDPFFDESNTNLSFFSFVSNIIDNKISNFDTLLIENKIDTAAYNYAKNVLTDEYLTRVGFNGLYERYDYDSKIRDSIFCSDLDSLFKHYTLDVPMNCRSLYLRAIFAKEKMIDCPEKDLGLGDDYIYLPEAFQETSMISGILAENNSGDLDQDQLDSKSKLFRQAFPSSKYMDILDNMTIPKFEKYILTTYDSSKGFFDTKNVDLNELSSIGELTQIAHPDKPVLIDLWATWCSPCISAMKNKKEQTKLNDFLSSNNIGLLYISIDKPGAYNLWKRKIDEIQIYGTHYLSTPDLYEQFPFVKNYGFVPHYILIDESGNILIENVEAKNTSQLISSITEKLKQ